MLKIRFKIFLIASIVIQLILEIKSQTCYAKSRNSKFSRLEGIDIINEYKTIHLIGSYPTTNKIKCLTHCTIDCSCWMAIIEGKNCYTYEQESKKYLMSKENNVVFIKKDDYYETELNGLRNSWPISNSTKDVAGGKDMTIVSNGELAPDRFNISGGSILFKNGYATVSDDVYFNPETGGFTAMAWIKYLSLNNFQRLFDFGMGQASENIQVDIYNKRMRCYVSGGETYYDHTISNPEVVLNQWFHVAVTFSSNTMKFYINGKFEELKEFTTIMNYKNIIRTSCKVGGSNWPDDPDFNGYIDEFKIYERVLNSDEILAEKSRLYNMIILRRLSVLNSQYSYTNGLTHSWPISGPFPGKDIIGGNDMISFTDAYFTIDRFGNADSALFIDRGIVKLPSDIYFDPETGGFTLMAWIKVLSLNYYQVFLDFGSGIMDNNILLEFEESTYKLLSYFSVNSNNVGYTSDPIENNEWVHVALTVEGATRKHFVNGILNGTKIDTQVMYQKIERTNCCFGSCNYDLPTHIILDDIKIFDRSLNADEIKTEMNKPEPYDYIMIN